MTILVPLFGVGGVGIASVHAATPDPLAELAALEPGEVVVVGRVASPPVPSSWCYRVDVRVEHLWYGENEVLRGGGVEVFAGDLGGVGVGDRVRVDGEISLPEPGEDDFDYTRYLQSLRRRGRLALSQSSTLKIAATGLHRAPRLHLVYRTLRHPMHNCSDQEIGQVTKGGREGLPLIRDPAVPKPER